MELWVGFCVSMCVFLKFMSKIIKENHFFTNKQTSKQMYLQDAKELS